MADKVRHTKLSKINHFYDLESDGKKFRIKIDERGRLHIFTSSDLKISAYGSIAVLSLEDK